MNQTSCSFLFVQEKEKKKTLQLNEKFRKLSNVFVFAVCSVHTKSQRKLFKECSPNAIVSFFLNQKLLVFHNCNTAILKMAYKNACQLQRYESKYMQLFSLLTSSRIDEFQMDLCPVHIHWNFHCGIHVNFPLCNQTHLRTFYFSISFLIIQLYNRIKYSTLKLSLMIQFALQIITYFNEYDEHVFIETFWRLLNTIGFIPNVKFNSVLMRWITSK